MIYMSEKSVALQDEKPKYQSIIDKLYHLFEDIDFSECIGCSKCCYFPWLLKEEYPIQLNKFGKNVREINSIAFIMDFTNCKFANENRCRIYLNRPIDCRLFPLDIIEEDGKYWWCIFTICPIYKKISEKLILLIPQLEKLISYEIFRQYKKQIAITKEIYPPYRLKLYEKIRPFKA